MFISWAASSLCSWHSWSMRLSTTYSLGEDPGSRRNRVNGSARPTMSATVTRRRGWESRFVAFFHCGRKPQTPLFIQSWVSCGAAFPITRDQFHFPCLVITGNVFLPDHFVIIFKPVSSGQSSRIEWVYPEVPMWLLVLLCWVNHTTQLKSLLQAHVASPLTPALVDYIFKGRNPGSELTKWPCHWYYYKENSSASSLRVCPCVFCTQDIPPTFSSVFPVVGRPLR